MNIEIFREIVAALSNPQAILGLFLLLGMLFQTAMLMRASRDKSRSFDLTDIIVGGDGRVSAAKFVQMVCLEAAIWAFVLYAIQTNLEKLGVWWFLLLLVGIGSPVVNKLADVVVSRWSGVPIMPDAPQAPPQSVTVEQEGKPTVKVTT